MSISSFGSFEKDYGERVRQAFQAEGLLGSYLIAPLQYYNRNFCPAIEGGPSLLWRVATVAIAALDFIAKGALTALAWVGVGINIALLRAKASADQEALGTRISLANSRYAGSFEAFWKGKVPTYLVDNVPQFLNDPKTLVYSVKEPEAGGRSESRSEKELSQEEFFQWVHEKQKAAEGWKKPGLSCSAKLCSTMTLVSFGTDIENKVEELLKKNPDKTVRSIHIASGSGLVSVRVFLL